MKIPAVGSKFMVGDREMDRQTNRQTDRPDEANTRFSQFCELVFKNYRNIFKWKCVAGE